MFVNAIYPFHKTLMKKTALLQKKILIYISKRHLKEILIKGSMYNKYCICNFSDVSFIKSDSSYTCVGAKYLGIFNTQSYHAYVCHSLCLYHVSAPAG